MVIFTGFFNLSSIITIKHYYLSIIRGVVNTSTSFFHGNLTSVYVEAVVHWSIRGYTFGLLMVFAFAE